MPRSRSTFLRMTVAVVLTALPTSRVSAQTTTFYPCYTFNTYVNDPQNAKDTTQHVTGSHQNTGTFSANCTYKAYGPQGQNGGACSIACTSTTSGLALELGTVVSPYWHGVGYEATQGNSTSNGAQISCGGQVAGAARSCVFPFNCDISVTVSGVIAGMGGSITYSDTPIWKSTLTFTNTCSKEYSYTLRNGPPFTSCPAPSSASPTDYLDAGTEYGWDDTSCSWVPETCYNGVCSY